MSRRRSCRNSRRHLRFRSNCIGTDAAHAARSLIVCILIGIARRASLRETVIIIKGFQMEIGGRCRRSRRLQDARDVRCHRLFFLTKFYFLVSLSKPNVHAAIPLTPITSTLLHRRSSTLARSVCCYDGQKKK